MSPALLAVAAAAPADRQSLIERMLEDPGGERLRAEIGEWVRRLVPVETLVPDAAARWRPLVADALQFLFSRMSAPRLAGKIAVQLELPPRTPPEKRLLALVARMPALQKIGQVLARNPRIPERLREALTELENGISDVTAAEVRGVIDRELRGRMTKFAIRVDRRILSEATVSAVIRFTWKNPRRERHSSVFKVLKPHIPGCFAEDLALLRQLGAYLSAAERGYGFAAPDVDQMLTEVRLLLEHELDFTREQATLAEAARTYRGTLGVRVPRVYPSLCTPRITAMSEENGVKVTDAVPRSPRRRKRMAEELIEALIAAPLFSAEANSTFHADPHAGNLLYHSPSRELIVLDWALAERLSLQVRRQLVLLAVMISLQNREGVRAAIRSLRRGAARNIRQEKALDAEIDRFFAELPKGRRPGMLDAMRLLDRLALRGVLFTAPLFLFRKSLFTLDGVIHDLAGSEVRIDQVIVRYFLTRWAASLGLFYSPLTLRDFLSVEWNALLYPARSFIDSGRAVRVPTPNRTTKSPRQAKSRPPAPPLPQSQPSG